MTKKIKDLAVKVGTYKKDGKDKNKYLNVGAILETEEGGKFMLLDRTFNPAGVPNPDNKSTVLISIFDINGAEESTKSDIKSPAADDEIPF